MKKVGTYSHISNKGNLIYRSPNTPPMGAFIFTEKKKKIGKINGIFGPTKNAYISIRPSKPLKETKYQPGDKLYLSEKSKSKRGRKKRKKK